MMIVFIPSVSSYLTLFNGIHGASLVAQLRILIGTNSQLENETKNISVSKREREVIGIRPAVIEYKAVTCGTSSTKSHGIELNVQNPLYGWEDYCKVTKTTISILRTTEFEHF